MFKSTYTMSQLLHNEGLDTSKSNFISSLLLFFGVLFFSTFSFAQNLENENEIIEYLGMEKYTSVLHSNPAYLKFLDVRCSDGYIVMDYVEEKMNDFPVLETITHGEWITIEEDGKSSLEFVVTQVTSESFMLDYESENFNFLEYRFTFDSKDVVYHVLGNTGKVIMILPIEKINKIVNKAN